MRGGVFDTLAPYHPSSLSLLPPARSRNRNQLLPTRGHAFTRAASEAPGGLALLIRPLCTIVHGTWPSFQPQGGQERIFTHMLKIHRQGLCLYKPLVATPGG